MLRNNTPISLHGEWSEIPQVWVEVKAEVAPGTELGPGSEGKELNFHRRMGTEHSSRMAGEKRVFRVRPGAATGDCSLQMEIENFESGGLDSKMSHSLGFHMCAGLWHGWAVDPQWKEKEHMSVQEPDICFLWLRGWHCSVPSKWELWVADVYWA